MKYGLRAAKVLVSAGLLAILCSWVQWEDVLAIARRADAGWLCAAVALSFVLVAASCWKWQILLRLQGHVVPFGPLYRWYFIGYFYSNFLPSNVGGDVARAWLAGRRIGSASTALVSVFAERFTGLVFLLLMAILLPFTDRDLGCLPALWIPAAAAFAGLLALAGLVLIWGAAARSARIRSALLGLRRAVGAGTPGPRSERWDRWAARAGGLVGRVRDLALELRTRPGAFAAVVGVTALFYGLTLLNVLVAYRAFGVVASAPGIARVLPAALMVSMLPITIGSIGLAEGAYVFYFGLLGLGRELTLAVGLLLRIKVLLLGAVGLLAQSGEPVRIRPPGPGKGESA
jgi:hypothetical protein